MNSLLSLKRERDVSITRCIICQKDSSEKLRVASGQGLETIRDCNERRKKVRGADFEQIERIEWGLSSENLTDLLWHKTCYCTYTNKKYISQMPTTKSIQPDSDIEKNDELSVSQPLSSVCRSVVNRADWSMCMFCQSLKAKEKLSTVSTFNMSTKIVEASFCDPQLHLRLANVNDLIAVGGKYHPNCYKAFSRKSENCKADGDTDRDIALTCLVQDLEQSASKGHVLCMDAVWTRFCDLSEEANNPVPYAYVSRRSTFMERVMPLISHIFELIFLKDRPVETRKTLLVPIKYRHVTLRQITDEVEENCDPSIPIYDSPDNSFLDLVHVALKLRSDILSHPVYKGVNVSESDAIDTVPDALYTFLTVMFGGQEVMSRDSDGEGSNDRVLQTKVLSLAQDLVYGVSRGKHLTPKHVGLGLTLHQATRSKQLVELFHNAGHIISYDHVNQIDTGLAESVLASMDPETGAVLPPNLVHDRFVHFTCDNIDINENTLDGKSSFHATQVAAWQRGPAAELPLKNIQASEKKTITVPDVLEELKPAGIFGTPHPEPVLTGDSKPEWYTQTDNDEKAAVGACATDMAFLLTRQHDIDSHVSWTCFNQKLCEATHQPSSIGYIPIITSPAHDMDTLNTVVQRCRCVADKLGQKYVVLTVDEALYCKLMELKWLRSEYQGFLIVRLGGLHTSLNFLKVIGQHMQSSGLMDVWVESQLLGPKAAEQVLAGKHFERGMRAHKITWQAMWRILMPLLLEYMANTDPDLRESIQRCCFEEDLSELVVLLSSEPFQSLLSSFKEGQSNANFKFWLEYLNMVQILLMYIRAQRDGLWDLHLHAFQLMLPYFHRYDHTNYARWGTVYIHEMHNLPLEVEAEFMAGNFVVKGSEAQFNQVDPDQGQEWMNCVGKTAGGIVGITKTPTALNRWTLSYNLRSQISLQTREMYGVKMGDRGMHKEGTAGRKMKDKQIEGSVMDALQRFSVFSDKPREMLQHIANKDVTPEHIQTELLMANKLGHDQLSKFISERLSSGGDKKVLFHQPLPKNHPSTFADLYVKKQLKKGNKQQVLKADRSVLQRLITAYESGRSVDLSDILKHELLQVPIALAELDKSLRTGNKAHLAEILTKGVSCPSKLTVHDLGYQPAIIIDGQALVVAMGKPTGASTFGELADSFVTSVLRSGEQFSRIEVVFDRYYQLSVKSGTRIRRGNGCIQIRRIIENRDVPLPSMWGDFLSMPENKSDLTRFLSEQLLESAPPDKILIVAGGFEDEEMVQSSNSDIQTHNLRAKHEEADTRMILHCLNNSATSIIVSSRDTDVLILLLAHFHKMPSEKIWLKSGTQNKRQYIPVHDVIVQLGYDQTVLTSLLPFHALTGSDTTSYFSGIGKIMALKISENTTIF